ncbi:hypothetical protein [Brevibacillus fulvus]|uniref:Uncharacterized protein n=1 Tax=Brevibacillus fulvus TaxID=1125967 RepID=A0A939BPG9_9BACL|nr:hypothetical protein [Brevibacillus fulvus]MBM7590460.1 hypothetical protein [Brevibacillus fulvus]
MAKPFEDFQAQLSWQQLSLLLDTVSYFQEAPKYLSLPAESGERLAVPLLADTLREMLDSLPEEEPLLKKAFAFAWQARTEDEGELHVALPNGRMLQQYTKLADFSPV